MLGGVPTTCDQLRLIDVTKGSVAFHGLQLAVYVLFCNVCRFHSVIKSAVALYFRKELLYFFKLCVTNARNMMVLLEPQHSLVVVIILVHGQYTHDEVHADAETEECNGESYDGKGRLKLVVHQVSACY